MRPGILQYILYRIPMLNELTYQIKLYAETLLFVTLQKRSSESPLLANISDAFSIVTIWILMLENKDLFHFVIIFSYQELQGKQNGSSSPVWGM